MSRTEVLRGRLWPDGTLELETRPTLPAGPVAVTLDTECAQPERDPWPILQQIWDERKSLGLQPRSTEEIDSEVGRQRDEWEERQVELEAIQRHARPRDT